MAIKLQLRIGYSGTNDTAKRHNSSWMSSSNTSTCCTMSQNYMGNTSFSRPTTRRWIQEANEAPTTDLLYCMSTQTHDFPPLIIVMNKKFSPITRIRRFPTQLTTNFIGLQRCAGVNAQLLAGSYWYLISVIWYISTFVSLGNGKTRTPITSQWEWDI